MAYRGFQGMRSAGSSLSLIAGLLFIAAGAISIAGKLGYIQTEIPYIDWAIAIGSVIGGFYIFIRAITGRRIIYA